MPSPRLLLKTALLLIWLGPFLAGLAAHPTWLIVPYGMIFLLWSVIFQRREWRGIPIPLLLAKLALVFSAVTATYLAGWLIGRFTLYLTVIPWYVPLIGASFAPILGRMAGDPAKAAEMEAFLDSAIGQIKAMPTPAGDDPQNHHAAARAVAERIATLPSDTDSAEIGTMIALGVDSTADATFADALDKAIGTDGRPARAARVAYILHVTLPGTAQGLVHRGLVAVALDVANDAALLGLFARRALALLGQEPQLFRDFPMPHDVALAIDRAGDAQTAKLLESLRDRLNRLYAAKDAGSDPATDATKT